MIQPFVENWISFQFPHVAVEKWKPALLQELETCSFFIASLNIDLKDCSSLMDAKANCRD